jgi:hypothetical protein
MDLATHITTITLAGGEQVGVFDFYVRATYALLWAGKPGEQLNESILNQCANDGKQWWHDKHEAHLLRPSDEQIHSQLPRYRMMALLDCSTPLNAQYHGSMLRVVWFSDTIPTNLEEFLQQSLELVDWKANAKDYFV